jgi:hypothetical protein
MAERIYKAVFPSGVPFSVRNLKGKDHETLTKSKNLKDGSAITKMLGDCLLSIGDDTNITEKFVEKLLSNDRKYALVTLRQHTLKFQESFDFKYDWPLDSGSKEKEVQEYSVKFTPEYFPCIPYKWVKERMKEIKRPALGEGEEPERERAGTSTAMIDDFEVEVAEPEVEEGEFPVMYSSYDEMLKKHGERELVLPESGEKITYKLLTVESEKKWMNISQDSISANTAIMMRAPKSTYISKNTGGPVTTVWDIKEADAIDIEYVRRDQKAMEGTVDTFLTIQHQTDKMRSVRVDLITITDFFFPSQAT